MSSKKWMKKLMVLAIALLPLCNSYAAGGWFSGNSKNNSWQEAVAKANYKVNEESASSVLGARVGEYVRRLNLHAQIQKKMQIAFDNYSQEEAKSCRTNYNLMKHALENNKLFSDYELDVIVPGDLCTLSNEELGAVLRVLQGKKALNKAVAYKHAFLLTIVVPPANLWFVVNPQDKTLTFNYNDPADLQNLKVLQGSGKELSVK